MISDTSVTFQDDLYQFMKQQRKRQTVTSQANIDDDHLSTIIPRLSPVIPKVRIYLILNMWQGVNH